MTFDDPLTYYEEVKSAKKRKKTEHQKDKEKKDKVPEVAPVDADGKRAITYQVSCSCSLVYHSHTVVLQLTHMGTYHTLISTSHVILTYYSNS